MDDTFAPYASSSRRLSTSIFSEEQSNDNFFITRTKSVGEATGPRHTLGDISEDSKSASESFLEITPSGNLDNIYESADRMVSRDSVFVDSHRSEDNESLAVASKGEEEVKCKHRLPKHLKNRTPSLFLFRQLFFVCL